MYLRYSVLWHAHWLYVLMLVPLPVQAAELHLGARSEITHPGKGHESISQGRRSPSPAMVECS